MVEYAISGADHRESSHDTRFKDLRVDASVPFFHDIGAGVYLLALLLWMFLDTHRDRQTLDALRTRRRSDDPDASAEVLTVNEQGS